MGFCSWGQWGPTRSRRPPLAGLKWPLIKPSSGLDFNAPLVGSWPLMPNPQWRIRHVARLTNGACRRPSLRISETHASARMQIFGPASHGKNRPSPPPMPSRVARSWNSGRSDATVSVPSDGPHDFQSCVGCAGSFGSWCSPRPHSGPDPHRACQRKPLSYF